MFTSWKIEALPGPAGWRCTHCGESNARGGLEFAIQRDPFSLNGFPAFAVTRLAACQGCQNRTLQFKVATVAASAVGLGFTGAYFLHDYHPAATYYDIWQGHVADAHRHWMASEVETPVGILHYHSFGPEQDMGQGIEQYRDDMLDRHESLLVQCIQAVFAQAAEQCRAAAAPALPRSADEYYRSLYASQNAPRTAPVAMLTGAAVPGYLALPGRRTR